MVFKKQIIAISLFLSLLIFSEKSTAQPQCVVSDTACVMDQILTTSKAIENQAWQDKALRELAKSLTHEGFESKALALISQIKTPDTKALTIRGIGFAAADSEWTDKQRYTNLFKNLSAEAEKIEHKPSYAIAYTYIAMAQAFAKDDNGAITTAKSIENEALRNKAFGETAEIQAERQDLNAALTSIAEINNLAFRNKAYNTVANIFTKSGELESAYTAANKIENPYTKTQALQKIVNFNNEEENSASKSITK